MPRKFLPRNQWNKAKKAKQAKEIADHNSRHVVNLSDEQLDAPTLSLLSKGLNFCPTPRPDHLSKQLTDLLIYERRCRLRLHFLLNIDPYDTPEGFKVPSAWTPTSGRSTALDAYLSNITDQILKSTDHPTRSNLTPDEQAAMLRLTKNNNIEIKSADKGGAIVVMNRSDYKAECLRQLRNKAHYARTGTDQTPIVSERVTAYLRACKKQQTIPDKVVDYLIPKDPRTAVFYILPKIHKENNPGRPIISANECPTEKISQFVDFHLRPLAQAVPSYIKDTNHFLEILHNISPLQPESIMCTIDVSALYTSIPHEEGIAAIKSALLTRPSQSPPTSVITHLTRMILTNNVFRFDDTHYRQIQGTAMGTKMAPSYAILFMAQLESEILKYEPTITLWKRYIDDIIMIFDHGEDELKKFLSHLNTLHPTIKFTFEYSRASINFLDVHVTKNTTGHLMTDLFVKPTDSHAYLNYSSCHPRHIVNSIPYSQALRIIRICSDVDSRKTRPNDLQSNLIARGFPAKLVRRSIDLASAPNRSTSTEKKTQSVPLILTFDPRKRDLNKHITNNEPLLNTDLMGQRFNEEYHTMITFRRPRNLKDILVHSDFVRKPKTRSGMTTCPKHCSSCPRIQPGTEFTSKATGETFTIQGSHNCRSSYIIYLIECSQCQCQYVGQTSNTLHCRLISHVSDIRRKKYTSIGTHFNSPGHNVNHLKATVIAPSYRDANFRMRHEEAWIRILKSWYPHGLNIKE